MSRTRYKIFDNAYPHFFTCTVVDWLPVFTRCESVQILLDSWSFLQREGRLELFAYVVLENHIHFIAASDNLSKEIGEPSINTTENTSFGKKEVIRSKS